MDISYNTSSDFPIVLTRLAQLAELDIAFNNISQLPVEITSLTNLVPGEIQIDGEVAFTRLAYNFKISGNKICTVSSEVESFLNKFAGDNWKERQICNE
jgi:hypothetical protein